MANGPLQTGGALRLGRLVGVFWRHRGPVSRVLITIRCGANILLHTASVVRSGAGRRRVASGASGETR